MRSSLALKRKEHQKVFSHEVLGLVALTRELLHSFIVLTFTVCHDQLFGDGVDFKIVFTVAIYW
jgi:hypothetical protein